MAKKSRYRLTNGHRAAVCGLALAGISLTQACEIVGVPYQQMRDLLGPWYDKRKQSRPKWNVALVSELREDWFDTSQKLKTIAARYDTTPRQLNLIAEREGWPRHLRKHGPPRAKTSFLSMTGEKRIRYWKLARVLGHKSAIAIVAEEYR
jgi:hypothetical protein